MNRETKYGCRQCPDYLPPEGKIIDGELVRPGLQNHQTMAGNGRCQKVFKMLRRLKACPGREERRSKLYERFKKSRGGK